MIAFQLQEKAHAVSLDVKLMVGVGQWLCVGGSVFAEVCGVCRTRLRLGVKTGLLSPKMT